MSHGGGGAVKDLIMLIIVLVVLWFLWLFTGGPARVQNKNAPFIQPLEPVGTGEVYGPGSQ